MKSKLRKPLSVLSALLMIAGLLAAAPITASAATVFKVQSGSEFVSALGSAADGDTIELTRSIVCTVPIRIDKTIIIDHGGNSLAFEAGLTVEGGELKQSDPGLDAINVHLDGSGTAALIVRDGKAEIDNVYAYGTDMCAVYVSNSTVGIYGNITCDCTHAPGGCVGVVAESNSTITIDGYMMLSDDATYIKINNTAKTQAQHETPTNRPEYLTYKDGTSTVWVRCSEHVWGEWEMDAAKHWLECSCGAIRELEDHIPGDWIIDKAATATTAGSKYRECEICGQVTAIETIAAIAPIPAQPDPVDESVQTRRLLLWGGIALGAAVLAAAVIPFAVARKRKKG